MKGEETETTKNPDKSLELVKIQIFSERANSRMTSQITNTYAIFIGFLIFFYTLFYEKVIPVVGFSIGIALFLAGTIYQTYHVRQVFKRDIKKISDLIEAVKKGNQLPKLEDLIR